ncbi:Adenine-specific methyltransferase [Thermococcus sp. 2319x1]|uniref:DNA methyltransferase n=1 Tax=Thermococcus sp. 2319x1 TaxID=1674923 RepID=UPI00073A85FD|nr:DNA methyltransferase [Thermococcus sp. 2319x1]ALV61995.1 Adenine-specific methyltransferase [Thermococcus sp. 2319x1]
MRDIILHGDVYACLDQLEDNSIAVAITSPPYWKQRDYGFDGQIGQENTPEEYIGRLVVVFSKLRQKMREDGVFFLNVGDKYLHRRYGKSHLLQIPYRLAYHMIKDGWYLEDVIIWYKPNHMPSSVKDRFTNTYEPVFVFAKSKNNIYKKDSNNVVKIPLQQTPWRHTAVFPEKLVEEMLNRINLNDGDLILDPFAGTGTVAVVVKKIRSGLVPKRIFSIMIEKGDHFIDIIKKRVGITDIKKVGDVPYEWKPVQEKKLPKDIEPKEILTDKHGEVFIADTSDEFLSALKGITTEKFKDFHREDALYFFGVKNWTILDLYYIHSIYYEGYVLRNMLVVSNGKKWYPIFMFAKDSTRTEYKFYLDRVRIRSKTKENRNWWNEDFIGAKVRDISGKKTKEGRIVKIIERYKDGFPKIVVVKWDGYASIEFVLHPEEDEFIMEGLIFKCPICGHKLEEPYDPAGKNICPSCGNALWTNIKTVPTIEEPKEITEVIVKLENINYNVGEVIKIEEFEEIRKKTKSKFIELERINWGASPGARKLMLGEYFTKMRLYRVDQPTIAQYLTILRKHKGLSIQDIINKLPKSYKHTVGHWFRKDFGGSVPIPEDIPLLKEIFGVENNLLNVLERTALKFQTVKTSIKGKNPGDFIEELTDIDLIHYLKKLYIPPQKYTKLIMLKERG